MNINANETQNDFFKKVNTNKLIISVLTMVLIFLEYFISDKNGSSATWGSVNNLNFFGLVISNVTFFLIVAIFGNFLILLTSFRFMNQSESSLFTEKQIQLVGLLLYLIGILSLFDFLFFEPFLLLYLSIIAVIYYGLVTGFSLHIFSFTINTRLAFISKGYTGYTAIGSFTVWTQNTKNFLMNFYNNQSIDLFLLLVIAFFLIQFYVFYSEKEGLLSQKYINKLDFLSKYNYPIQITQVNILKLMVIFLLFEYLLMGIFLLMPSFFLTLCFFLIVVPFYKKRVIALKITTLFHLIEVRIYDLYILNIIFVLVISYLISFTSFDIFYFIAFIISFWIAIRLIEWHVFKRIADLISLIFDRSIRESTADESNTLIDESKQTLFINISNVSSSIFFFLIIIWASAWFSTQDESLFFSLLFFATILRFSPFIIRNFLNSRVIKYSMRRIALIIPMTVGISMVIFGTMSLAGNPVDVILAGLNCGRNLGCRQQNEQYLNNLYGFNNPIPVQWFHWFFHFLQGDLGQELSTGSHLSVASQVMIKIGPTMEISVIPVILALVISIPLGIIASKNPNSFLDSFILIFVSIGIALPIFFFILVMILVMSYYLLILPPFGRHLLSAPSQSNLLYAHLWTTGVPINFHLEFGGITYLKIFIPGFPFQNVINWVKWDWLFHVILPIVSITLISLALYTRLVRGGMIETMRNDYILSARASGFTENDIINKFALRNVLLPVITLLGLNLGVILAGAPITETVLHWPGLGYYSIIGLRAFDYSIIMATSMIVGIMILFSNLLTDIVYSIIDPRITLD